jgi:tRNA dimethylallyltransferase
MSSKKVLLILGPTTTGKTEVALACANKFSGEIINADKFHLFKGFNYSTGSSDVLTFPSAKTHLYGILDPIQHRLNTEEYVKIARSAVFEVLKKGKLSIVEGCSFGYINDFIKNGKIENAELILVGLSWPKGYDIASALKNIVKDKSLSLNSQRQSVEILMSLAIV